MSDAKKLQRNERFAECGFYVFFLNNGFIIRKTN